MKKEGGALLCTGARRHCYDVASAGYVNLAGAKQAGGGDDAALIRAHRIPRQRALCADRTARLRDLTEHLRGRERIGRGMR
jgi:hypothetical protein